jgi:hypothetical protein
MYVCIYMYKEVDISLCLFRSSVYRIFDSYKKLDSYHILISLVSWKIKRKDINKQYHSVPDHLSRTTPISHYTYVHNIHKIPSITNVKNTSCLSKEECSSLLYHIDPLSQNLDLDINPDPFDFDLALDLAFPLFCRIDVSKLSFFFFSCRLLIPLSPPFFLSFSLSSCRPRGGRRSSSSFPDISINAYLLICWLYYSLLTVRLQACKRSETGSENRDREGGFEVLFGYTERLGIGRGEWFI